MHLNDVGKFEHVDFAVTTVHASKPYKFGNILSMRLAISSDYFIIIGLWLTQINCRESTAVQAPAGCTQYHFGNEGVIKSFNFEGVQYLASQNYKIWCVH